MIETKMPTTAERLETSFEHLGRIPAFLIGSNEPYKVQGEASEAERKRVKAAFIAGDMPEPMVSYPRLNDDALLHGERQIFHVLEQINQLPENLETNLAHEVIARQLAVLYRHREVARSLVAPTPEAKAQSLERAKDLTLEVFGEPDRQDFDGLLALQSDAAAGQLDSSDPVVQTVARDFLRLTGTPEKPAAFKKSELSDKALQVLNEDLHELFPQIFELATQLPADRKLSHEESLTFLQNAINALGMKGWHAVLTEGNVIEVSANKKEVQLGRNRAQFTAESIVPKTFHEVVWHGLRAFNAEQSALTTDKKVAGVSLPGALLFDEGGATGAEQIVNGKRAPVGEQYYLSCGLQLGMDGRDERTYRQTYEFMWRRAVLSQAQKGAKISIEKAQAAAYQAVMRTRRGGVIDTRDLSYYDGFKKAVGWFNAIAELPKTERKSLLLFALSAKHDPTDVDQTEYILA